MDFVSVGKNMSKSVSWYYLPSARSMDGCMAALPVLGEPQGRGKRLEGD